MKTQWEALKPSEVASSLTSDTCIQCRGIICIKHPDIPTHRVIGDLRLLTTIEFPQTIEQCLMRKPTTPSGK